MSFIPKDVQDDLDNRIEKTNDKKKNVFGIEKNKDEYANISNDEIAEIDTDVNQLRINVDDSIDRPTIKINEIIDEDEYIEDIDDYFSTDEQFELVSNGIKITTSKQYKIQKTKSPIWRGNVTKVFLKWLKDNHPDELKFIKKTIQTEKKEKVFLSAKDLSKKMEDHNKKKERETIDEIYNDNEQNELLEKGIQFKDAIAYYKNTEKKAMKNGKITNEFKAWLKENNPISLSYIAKTKETKKTTEKAISNKNGIDLKNKQDSQLYEFILCEKWDRDDRAKGIIQLNKLIEEQIRIEKCNMTEALLNLINGFNLNLPFEPQKEAKKKIKNIIETKQKPKKEKKSSGVFNISKPKTKPQPIVEAGFTVIETETIEEPSSEIIVQDQEETYPIQQIEIKRYPTEAEILFLIKRHKFVKENLLDKDDSIFIKKKGFIKKSGWRKFINAFGISIELIDQKVYEKFDDKHAEVRVRAIAPNGQSVEGIGIKSWSELYDKNMHNLVANAWTRAVNRAVSDLVGYGAVSADELSKTEYESDVF